jgi:hypothetical protein
MTHKAITLKFVVLTVLAVALGDLAKQSYKPFGGFVAKMTPTDREVLPRDARTKMLCLSRGFFSMIAQSVWFLDVEPT